MVLIFTAALLLLSCSAADALDSADYPDSPTLAFERSYPRLCKLLEKKQLEFGAPLFIRIFKQENELEVWLEDKRGTFKHLKTYPICFHSGTIGPKLEEGDLQSPEGFYRVEKTGMNPWSNYHLAINLGYPNAYDTVHERTGGDLMIHGRCSSSGCFAMTDYYMDELYTIADAAFSAGQNCFQVHIFPFRFTGNRLENYRGSRWENFWHNLREGYRLFEKNRTIPEIGVINGRYVFPRNSR